MRMNKRALLVKNETVYATDAAPVGGTNAMLCRSIKFKPLNMSMDQRNLIRPYFANFEEIPGASWGEFEVEFELQGSSTLGTPPAWGPIMRGCAHAEVITASTKVEYNPISDAEEAITAHYFKDGNVYKVIGAKGSFGIELNAQKILVGKAKFMGLRVAVNVASLPVVTLTAWKKPLAVNKTNTQFTLHGYAAALESFSFDSGVVTPYVNRPNREAVDFTDRKAVGSVSIEEPLQSVIDYFDRANQVTTGSLALAHGTVAGLRVKLDAPVVQVGAMDESENQNIAMGGMSLRFMPTAGNDEYKITLD